MTDRPLFKLLTLQTALPLDISEESIELIIRHVDASGYIFTASVEEITIGDLHRIGEEERP